MLVRLVHQTLFKRFLLLDAAVRVAPDRRRGRCRRCAGRRVGAVRLRIVFGQDPRSVVGGEDENRVHGKERHVGGHLGGDVEDLILRG